MRNHGGSLTSDTAITVLEHIHANMVMAIPSKSSKGPKSMIA